MAPRSFLPFLTVALFALHGCTLDRSVIAAMPGGSLVVGPLLACPGDTVHIAWETRRPRNEAFCAFANGNTAALLSCRISADCADEEECLDGYCNNCDAITNLQRRQTECAAPSFQGCEPNLNVRIQVTPEPDPPLADASDITQHRGERSFVIQETSAIAFRSEVIDAEGQRAGVAGAVGRIDLDARVEVIQTDLRRTAANAFECRGTTPNWAGVRLEDLYFGASPNLHLLSIHNPNGFAVVGNLNGDPLRLEARETISLNLPLFGPIQAQPDAAFLRTLPPVRCTATDTSGSLPSAPLQLKAGCVAP
ncbi:hypothetical protein [Pseudomonas sp. ML96]|uniref:hypothetical protein n=1 Tax=Pseudomonas sp. ML96 TaxID=1523503 RepID=UPI0005BCEE38|nr:hypothetical protein [Pseudomonas sp. ML96]